jgi:class 3 adenylate cyclase/tetratricopeptide (TPR) repeat protein
VICSNCRYENDPAALVCERCGTALDQRCPSCGASVPQGNAFCGACGARLDEPSPAARTEPGDRRVVTALFADLSGFTPLAEQLDPEDLSALVNECFTALMEEVTLREGWLEKQIGDALVAFFGAPVVHEDDPVRAVQAGLAMHERMQEINARVESRIGRPLELHIGINTGLVVIGPGIEPGGQGEIVVLGDTVNTAARFQQVARPGQLIVGEATHAGSRWAFEYRRLPPLSLKGKAERIVAYECLGPREQPASARGFAEAGLGSELCGRDAELATLVAGVERLSQGRGGIVSVVGEAGLGKSRLVAETGTAPIADKVRWLEGRSLSFGQTISYFPFVEVVKRDAGIAEEDDEDKSWTKLEARIRQLFPADAGEVLPYVAVLLAIDVRGELEERVKYLDGEAMRHQIFRASRLYFERLALERPTVLVFEDFHWADQSSEGLLEHLLPLVETVPLLVVCPTRPDPDTSGGRFLAYAGKNHSERYVEIRLAQLSDADSGRLVQNLLQIELSPKLLRIFKKTEGNPFYVEELVRSLIDLGAVERDEGTGRWELVANVDELAIPDTIQGVIMARVDRLDDEAKQVLRTAAVIGRSFFYQVLRSLTEVNGKLDRRLADLETLELIRKKGLAAELEYIFKHALTQEAVYGSILMRRRRELHARVARCIEELFPDRLDEFYALLAHHYAQAEQWELAQDYLFKAGDRAGAIASDSEALAHYQQALAAYTRAFGERWDAFQRATLERKMGEAFFRRGENDLALEHFERALRDLGAPYPATRWRVRFAIVKELLRQIGHVLAPWIFLRGRPAEPDRAAPERTRIYEDLGWIHFFTDRERLLLDGLLLLNTSERSGHAQGIVGGQAGLTFALDLVPLFRLGERYARQSVALGEQVEQPNSRAFAYFALGFHQHRLGQVGDARENYELCLAAYLRAGELRKWAGAARQLARLDLLQGNASQSYELASEMARVGEDAGDPQAEAWGRNSIEECVWRLGAAEEAVPGLRDVVAMFELLHDVGSMVAAHGDLGQALLRRGDVSEAIELLEETQGLIAQYGLRGYYCTEPRLALAEAYLTAAEQAEGPERSALMVKAKRACKASRKEGKFDRHGVPAAERLSGRYWWLAGKRGKAEACWQRSISAAESLDARYELGCTYAEIGRWTEDRTQRERGEAILTEMREQLDAKRERSASRRETLTSIRP